MTDTPNATRSPLLPDRHPIQDFFICDVTDAIPKDDMGAMENPIFSLATKPDVYIREYEHKGTKTSILLSALGLATIHDKDVLIYCISQLVAKMNTGVELHRTLHLKAYDLLVATNRNTDGADTNLKAPWPGASLVIGRGHYIPSAAELGRRFIYRVRPMVV